MASPAEAAALVELTPVPAEVEAEAAAPVDLKPDEAAAPVEPTPVPVEAEAAARVEPTPVPVEAEAGSPLVRTDSAWEEPERAANEPEPTDAAAATDADEPAAKRQRADA